MNIHINVDTVNNNTNNANDNDNHTNNDNNVNNNNIDNVNNNVINVPAADEEAVDVENQALAIHPRGKRILVAALGSIIITILSVLLASILPWFEVANVSKYYSQDQYLWLFLLPPLSAVPLMFSSITLAGRICWLHCWTVTVISIDVPSAVIFVSFGASLVYTGRGGVLWSSGAFLVVFAHIASIAGGLLFMKLAQIVEMGPQDDGGEEGERPPAGPITVSVGIETDKEESKMDEQGFTKYVYQGGLVVYTGGSAAS